MRSIHSETSSALVGVDLGGTKIEIAALDRGGTEILRRRIPSPSQSYDALVRAIVQLVDGVDRELGIRLPVGFGTPGAPSRSSGLMKNCNSTVLNGRPLADDLARVLDRPVRLANDANTLALSEVYDGAAAGAAVVFGVILGTGCGGGIVVNGSLVNGCNAIAGEWGHNPLPWPHDDERPGPPCYCGKSGCIETFLSGPGLSRDDARGGEARDASSVADAAARGEPRAIASLERWLDRLARSLANVIGVLDPDVVVFGGGLSNIAAIYAEMPPRLERYVFSDTVETRIVRALHGDASGVRGAARLWDER